MKIGTRNDPIPLLAMGQAEWEDCLRVSLSPILGKVADESVNYTVRSNFSLFSQFAFRISQFSILSPCLPVSLSPCLS